MNNTQGNKNMKLVISNIAWTNEEEAKIAELLQRIGVTYVEVAPTKQWQDPTTEASTAALAVYKTFWAGYGIEIVAFQSMLFNRPDLKIFESEALRKETLEYLQRFIALAPQLGAGVMVFGSPKNRQHGNLPLRQAEVIANNFFNELGKTARKNNVVFCIEPNPTDYACDFVTNAQQGIDIVRSVNNPGFGLHLDIAGMTLAKDNVVDSIKAAGKLIQHFHISAPFLEQVEDRGDVDYRGAAKALKDINYDRFVSIEMKPGEVGTNLQRVEKAVRFAQSIYSS